MSARVFKFPALNDRLAIEIVALDQEIAGHGSEVVRATLEVARSLQEATSSAYDCAHLYLARVRLHARLKQYAKAREDLKLARTARRFARLYRRMLDVMRATQAIERDDDE